MKKLLALILIATALVCFAGCSSGKSVAPSGMINATAPDAYAYTLYVPATWQDSSFGGVSMAIYSPEDPTSISVSQYKLSAETPNRTAFWDVCKKDYEKNFENFKVVTSGNCMLDGQEAGQYEYTVTVSGIEMKYMNVITVKDGMAYLLSYASLPESYDSHLEDVTKAIQSFIFN